MQRNDPDIDDRSLSHILGYPVHQVIDYTVACEDCIIKIHVGASFVPLKGNLTPICLVQYRAEQLQDVALALALLLDVQDVC